MHSRPRFHPVVITAAIAGLLHSAGLVAASAPVYGGPTYNPSTSTGYDSAYLPTLPSSTAGNGVGVGIARKSSNGAELGERAIRWNAAGIATELGTLGTDTSGYAESTAYAVNATGTAVGYVETYNGSEDLGPRAVRWDPSTTTPTPLGSLAPSSNGETYSIAYAINDGGTTVGSAAKYAGGAGIRAVRWSAAGEVTELGNLDLDNTEPTSSRALAINAHGTAAGISEKHAGGKDLGFRAVRWDANGTAATELGDLGTSSSGTTQARAYAINSAGTVVGYVDKYVGGTRVGSRAVRWDSTGTAATELGGLASAGSAESSAFDVNDSGAAIGHVGNHSVRWDAAGVATELQSLNPAQADNGLMVANAINNSGTAVGTCLAVGIGVRAVAWKADGVAIDLNTLLSGDDATHWRLETADGFSESYWVSGVGVFDPDGTAGSAQTYSRAYLLDVISVFGTPGDATRNGSVNFDDLVPLAQHYNLTSGQKWDTGDFTGDGAVDFDDLVILAQHYNSGPPALDGFGDSFASDWALAQSLALAPEPMSFSAILAIAFATTLNRRRRVACVQT